MDGGRNSQFPPFLFLSPLAEVLVVAAEPDCRPAYGKRLGGFSAPFPPVISVH